MHRLVAEILSRRGIPATGGFLDPRLQDLGDPFQLSGMRETVARLLTAIDAGENVTLYGDYDVDGVASLALMRAGLVAYGLEPAVTLPHRMDEGYGLSEEGIARCIAETRPSLLIAIDCGTTSLHEARLLADRGVDLIILDHHEPGAEGLPRCVGIVNPKASGEQSYLCSAGVVFKVLHALLKSRPLPKDRFDLKRQLDLVALATVADIVPLLEENRLLVKHGLRELGTTTRPGLVALKSLVGVGDKPKAGDVGFKLGPRLNAVGRLDTARHAYDLLVSGDAAESTELAGLLDEQNKERQHLEQTILARAMEQAAAQPEAKVLVLAGDDWHPGVVGIVAARVMRQFHRPCFVIGFDDHELGKGSARSIPGVSLTALIAACKSFLVKGGGHDMAAGISIHKHRVDGFRAAITAEVERTCPPEVFLPTVTADMVVRLADLDHSLLDAWEALAPFGNSFHEPQLMACGVTPANAPRILKEKHYKFTLCQGDNRIDAIWFQGATKGTLPPPPWDVIFHLDANEWNGRRSPQMKIEALRQCPI